MRRKEAREKKKLEAARNGKNVTDAGKGTTPSPADAELPKAVGFNG